jgi:glycyl-tRNA synthetase beta chain
MAMGGELDENIFVSELRKLAPAIDAFFDKVMVMVDDSKKRSNRLGLLRSVDALFRKIGDFSKIVIEGE